MEICNVFMVIFLVFSLYLGFSLFFNQGVYGSYQVKYKTFQKEGVSFKYPNNWRFYTSKMEPEAFVAIGDPKTVGFDGMDIATSK